MSDGLNRAMLMGHLGADPELRFTAGGQAVLNMRLATSESYLDKNKERKERTDWHNVVVWGARAEGLAKILRKGSGIFIEGSIRTSSYDDRDGNKKWKTEIVANNVILTGGRGGGEQRTDDPGQGYDNAAARGGGGWRGSGGGGNRSASAPRPAAPAAAPADDYAGDTGGGYDDSEIPF